MEWILLAAVGFLGWSTYLELQIVRLNGENEKLLERLRGIEFKSSQELHELNGEIFQAQNELALLKAIVRNMEDDGK